MSPLELDLTNVEAWEGTEILPAGDHEIVVDTAKESTSTGGYPQLELQLRAVSGPHQGGQIRDWIIVTAQSAGRVKQVLGALGVDVSGKIKLEASSLKGRRAGIIVRTEPDRDGNDRQRVKAYRAASGAAASAAAPPPTQAKAASDDDDLPF